MRVLDQDIVPCAPLLDQQLNERTEAGPGAPESPLSEWTGWLLASDGLRLYVREWWRPDVAPRYVVLLSHGLGEHANRYRHVAAALAARGAHIVAPDHRGFGQSAGRRGYTPSLQHLLDDLDLSMALARRRHPDLPIVLLGHSMGGVIAIAYTIERHGRDKPNHTKLDAVIYSAPALLVAGSRATQIFGLVMDRVWPTFAVRRPLNGALLSRDPAIHAQLVADQWCHNAVTARLYAEIFQRGSRLCLNRAAEITQPCLILHGTADPLVKIIGSQMLADRISSAKKLFVSYPEMRHEVFNEIGGDAVIAEMCSWINDVLPAQRSASRVSPTNQ